MSLNVGIEGERDQGIDVRTNNICAIANIVKSSLGPQGLDKMIVDDVGEVLITNDGATILKRIQVEHPAAKVLVQLSQLQDAEVGDGTTSVVILAAELLKRAGDLIRNKVHPTVIINGYKMAARQACRYIEEKLSLDVGKIGEEDLLNAIKTSMSSKLIGSEKDFFAKLVIEAVHAIRQQIPTGTRFPIKAINVLKSHGKSILDSKLVRGYAVQTMKSHQLMPSLVKNAKLAVLDFNLQKFRLQLGVQVLVDDPKNLEQIRKKECDVLKVRVEKILAAGANVIITTMGLDEMASKYLLEAGALGIRRLDKSHANRIAKLTGATVITTMANPEGEEYFDSSALGECEEVFEEALGDNDFIFFKGCKYANACTVVVRGANEFMCEEVERSLHDSICVAKRVLESGKLVVGGGAVEVALSVYLEKWSSEHSTKEQIAIATFAEALTCIPKILANNAAKDAIDLLSKLRVLHTASQAQENSGSAEKLELKYCGLDLEKGKPRNNLKAGVLQPMVSKVKSLRFATEAAITILRIDDSIKLDPKREEDPRGGH